MTSKYKLKEITFSFCLVPVPSSCFILKSFSPLVSGHLLTPLLRPIGVIVSHPDCFHLFPITLWSFIVPVSLCLALWVREPAELHVNSGLGFWSSVQPLLPQKRKLGRFFFFWFHIIYCSFPLSSVYYCNYWFSVFPWVFFVDALLMKRLWNSEACVCKLSI